MALLELSQEPSCDVYNFTITISITRWYSLPPRVEVLKGFMKRREQPAHSPSVGIISVKESSGGLLLLLNFLADHEFDRSERCALVSCAACRRETAESIFD